MIRVAGTPAWDGSSPEAEHQFGGVADGVVHPLRHGPHVTFLRGVFRRGERFERRPEQRAGFGVEEAGDRVHAVPILPADAERAAALPLVVRAPQGAVGVQAHQQPRARVLELVRVEGARVLDEVVFGLVPGGLIDGVRDAAHRVPNQPHVLRADVPRSDRRGERGQFRWQQLTRWTATGQGPDHRPARAATPPPPRSSSAAAAETPPPCGSRAAPPNPASSPR